MKLPRNMKHPKETAPRSIHIFSRTLCLQSLHQLPKASDLLLGMCFKVMFFTALSQFFSDVPPRISEKNPTPWDHQNTMGLSMFIILPKLRYLPLIGWEADPQHGHKFQPGTTGQGKSPFRVTENTHFHHLLTTSSGLVWFTMVYKSLLWFTMVYYGLLWFTVVYYGLL